MLTVNSLSKQFARQKQKDTKKLFGKHSVKTSTELFYAVHDISFQADAGEILGILGPNGAGKTTLLRMLGGILTPTTGSVDLCGESFLHNAAGLKSKIGYLSGNTKLYGRLSTRELLETFGALYQMDKGQIKASIAHLEERLELTPFMDNRIETLSTGQTQRASIARCLLHDPLLYILDEPTLGLDVLGSRSVLSFMKNERERGKIVLYSTHYMEEAETLCDRILMLHQGELLTSGTPAALKEQFGADNLRDVFFAIAEGERGGLK